MNPSDIPSSSVEELADDFRCVASAHSQATLAGDHENANRHHDIIAALYRELRARGASAQKVLLPLMQDPDDAVQSWAASHALEFAPEQAESVPVDLAEGRGISAFNAKMTLWEWRKESLSFP